MYNYQQDILYTAYQDTCYVYAKPIVQYILSGHVFTHFNQSFCGILASVMATTVPVSTSIILQLTIKSSPISETDVNKHLRHACNFPALTNNLRTHKASLPIFQFLSCFFQSCPCQQIEIGLLKSSLRERSCHVSCCQCRLFLPCFRITVKLRTARLYFNTYQILHYIFFKRFLQTKFHFRVYNVLRKRLNKKRGR